MGAADQTNGDRGDVPSATHDGTLRILTEQHDTTAGGVNLRASTAADSAALVNSNALPGLHIEGHNSPAAPPESGFMHFVHDGVDLAKDGINEVVNHPDKLLLSAEIGLIVGAATLAMPEIAIGFGVVAGAGLLAKHVGGWMPDANVASSTKDHTAAEVDE